jgi:uncharacterized protein YciI
MTEEWYKIIMFSPEFKEAELNFLKDSHASLIFKFVGCPKEDDKKNKCSEVLFRIKDADKIQKIFDILDEE